MQIQYDNILITSLETDGWGEEVHFHSPLDFLALHHFSCGDIQKTDKVNSLLRRLLTSMQKFVTVLQVIQKKYFKKCSRRSKEDICLQSAKMVVILKMYQTSENLWFSALIRILEHWNWIFCMKYEHFKLVLVINELYKYEIFCIWIRYCSNACVSKCCVCHHKCVKVSDELCLFLCGT